MKHFKLAVAGAALLASLAASAEAASTLETVVGRGKLICGVNPGLPGFGAPNDKGEWAGLDIDFCRAVAAAVLGDANKVEFKPLNAEQRFTALQTGEIDVLARNSTWSLTRDSKLGLDFVTVNYYDGQGFMVRKGSVASALELKGASVCVQEGTTTEKNLGDFDASNKLGIQQVKFKESEQARTAYDEGRCDAYTTDSSGLAAERTALKDPASNVILPEIISKEPLGPVVRHGDNQWGDIIRWTHFVMLIGEEKGITKDNVDQVKGSTQDPEVRRLFSAEEDWGAPIALGKDWAYNILKQVGNYSESFERNVGSGSKLQLARGLNALWSAGGLQYAAPFR